MSINERNLKANMLYKVDENLQEKLSACWEKLIKLNNAKDIDEMTEIAQYLFGAIGEGSQVLAPFRCNYGTHIYIGSYTFINFNVSMLDVGEITIGDNVLIGPGTGLFTAIHPTDPGIRAKGVQKAKPIFIEDKVWIGGNVTTLPGVKIGEGAIIGAGAVVTKDIPPMAIAVGNPARIVRYVNDEDRSYWKEEYQNYLKEYE